MNPKTHAIAAPLNVSRMVEDIVGCKWSLAVLGAVRGGVRRPGAMEHAIEGLSKKVLNERLSKLVRFGILEKQAYLALERVDTIQHAAELVAEGGERYYTRGGSST